jgi:predicted dehydrogenase
MSSSDQDRVRVAVVGCGAVASLHHLPGLMRSRRAAVTLLVDADRARAQTLADRFGVPAVATDPLAAAEQAEAAILALPNHLHAPVAIDLLARGVHVLVEKPMALSLAEADAMIAAAERARRVLAVGLGFRFFDSTALVAELLASGILGPLAGFEMRLGVISRWPFASDFVLRKATAGGGVLADYGVHVLDLLLVWLGEWRAVVYRDDARGGLESDCELELEMASGLRGFVEISRSRNLRNTCRFAGERGVLEVGVWDPDPEIRLEIGGRELALAGRARGRRGRGLDWDESFRRQLDDFLGAVREGREPRVPGREGRRGMALIEACYTRRQPLVLPWDVPVAAEGA